MSKSNNDSEISSDAIIDNKHRTFIELQNNCPLCGGELVIKVESYLYDYTLREEAQCVHCDVLARVKDHRMH